MDNAELYFLRHHKGGYIAEGPFCNSEDAQEARAAHKYSAHQYDIVVAEIPITVWEFNDIEDK